MNTDPLVSMLVAGMVAAFLLGFIAHKVRLPPVVGYLLAGVAIGPHTPGLPADADLAQELADLGVILILFGVGLKFSPRQLMAYRWVALPGALGQMALVTMLGLGVSQMLDMKLAEGLIFGFSLSVASTIVLLRALESRGDIASPGGHLAVSWLMVQNVAAVLALVLMAALAATNAPGAGGVGAAWRTVALKFIELALFVVILIVVGRRILPTLLVFIARARSRELFSLGVFAIALGIAFAAHALLGASFALGAFAAGVVLNEADLSHRAAEDLIPLRDAFAVLFFVSMGMLFDPKLVVSQAWTVAGVTAIVIFGNGAAAYLMTALLRVPPAQRLLMAGGLAQIGEFSFLICGTGLALDLVSDATFALVTAVALITIAINPILRQILRLVGERSPLAAPSLSRSA